MGRSLPGSLKRALERVAGPDWREVSDEEAEAALEQMDLGLSEEEPLPAPPTEDEPAIGFHVHERMDSPRDDGQAPTLMKSATPAATTSGGLRKLTPTECERLMGWPDGWTVMRR